MVAIISGHGARLDDKKTFVPVGTTLRFYSAYDVDLNAVVSLAALADGARAGAQETIVGTGDPDDVTNYELGAEDDESFATWFAMTGGRSDVPIWWVGQEIKNDARLCNDRAGCLAAGEHLCDGALGLVKDTEIVVLACRGYIKDDDGPEQSKYGTDQNNPLQKLDSDNDAMVDEILKMAAADLTRAEAWIGEFPQASVALFNTRGDFKEWNTARVAKDYAQANDVEQLIGHLRTTLEDGVLTGLNDFPSYGAAVDDFATEYGATFVGWLNSKGGATLIAELKKRPAIDTAIKQVAAGVDPGQLRRTVDPAAVRSRNVAALRDIVAEDAASRSAQVMQGADLVLLGEGHDFNAVRDLGSGGKSGTVTFTRNTFSANEIAVSGEVDKSAVIATLRELIADPGVAYPYRDRDRVVFK